MKAKPLIFTAGIGAVLVIVWMLLWRPTVLAPDTSPKKAAPTVDDILPLPRASVPLTAPALLPPPEEPWYDTGAPEATESKGGTLPPEEQKPYAPAPPPNPNAVPPWRERLPHRESQIPRTLLTNPEG